jgi:hypothetical protein
MIYRGNEPDWIYQAAPSEAQTPQRRAVRLLDTYLPITQHHLGDWAKLKEASGLFNIPSSRFLRPYSSTLRALEPLRLRRITSGMEAAAKTGKIYHLWWHPHNFGLQQEENLRFLSQILAAFKSYQQSYGMVSLNMKELVDQLCEKP